MHNADEFAGAGLGDERLDRRLVAIAEAVSKDPEESFPDLLREPAELEAGYRFFNNERVTPSKVLAPHVRATVARCREAGRVVIAHDTTEFSFGRSDKDRLGRVGRGASAGFYGHFSLAVAVDRERDVLGVLGMRSHTRTGSGTRKPEDVQNEGRRWLRAIDAAEHEHAGAIHVADREADSFELLAAMNAGRLRYVLRVKQVDKRRLDGTAVRLGAVLEEAAFVTERSVPITARGKGGKTRAPSYRKNFPAREGRTASLSISVARVALPRPPSSRSTKPSVEVNVVCVREVGAPDGETPVEWTLWTNEPVDTPEQVLAVVDAYRCRWRIEEFFKALKSGCAVETRQLESLPALLNVIALFSPIAWQLLRLRTLARANPDTPATSVLHPRRLDAIRAALPRGRKPMPAQPSVRDAMLAIAGIGGHIVHNGDPGWAVLTRGFEHLLSFEAGFFAARSDQS